MSNLPANRPNTLPAIGMGAPLTLRPKTMQEAMQLADLVARSSFCPKSFRDRDGKGNAGDILIVLLQCEQLDLALLQGLSGIAVVNGKPSIWGDLGPALVLRSGLSEYFLDDWDDATQTAIVRTKRKGKPAREFTFSWADACKAKLDQKDTYKLFRKDMCTWRAKNRAIRTEYPDVLQGMEFAEDRMAIPESLETVEPEPIRMPREIGAPTPQEQETMPESGLGYRDPEPADEGAVQIFVVSAEEKAYTNSKTKKPGKYYVIEFSDAQIANTFSETFFNLAHDAGANQKPVKYTVVAGRKYQDAEGVERQGWNLDTLELAPVAKSEAPAEGGGA